MRTSIVLDDKLVEEASKLTGIKTKRELVNEALRILVSVVKRRSFLELEEKVLFAEGYGHKTMRRGRA